MSRDQRENEQSIRGLADLVAYFEGGTKAPDWRGIGTEHEKFGVWEDSLAPLTHEGDRGIERVFHLLIERYGWEAERDRGRVVSLVHERGGALTLEPGGQFELSGAVTRNLHETAAELDLHLTEVKAVSAELGIAWMGAGCHPLAEVAEIPWMPKRRYELMGPFLGARGDLAHAMMKATCTVQVNLDYTSEADAAEIMTLAARLSPIVSALFANSPILGRRDTAFATYRCHIWTRTDPARTGTPAFFLDGSFSFEQYAQWLLDVPMLFIRRGGVPRDVAGMPFRRFLADGFEGQGATIGDWELHLSTAFPDVRLKRFIEMRTADGGGRDSILGLPALWRAVIYDAQARAAAGALVEGMTPAEHKQLFADVARRGLGASWRGRPVRETAAKLVEIARVALNGDVAGRGPESIYLDPLIGWLEEGRSPADRQRSICMESHGDYRALMEMLRF